MKKNITELIITAGVILALSIIIYVICMPMLNSIWVLVVAFFSMLCSYYQMRLLCDWKSPSWRTIIKCSSWYIKGIPATYGYGVLFFFHATGIAIVCFVLAFVITLIASPVIYYKYYRNEVVTV